MPKVLILCAHRPNRSPSQRYRFEQYLSFLTKNGFNFTWSYLLNEKDDKVFYSQGRLLSKVLILIKTIFMRFADCRRFNDFDIVFIQREAHFFGTSYFERKAYKSRCKIIFDFDDSIWLNDASPQNKFFGFLKGADKFYSNIANAHLVIAGNDYLQAEANKTNVNTIVIPTTVDTSILYPIPSVKNKNIITIGWSGSVSTLVHFETIIPVLKKLKQVYGPKLRIGIISQSKYQHPDLDIDCQIWSAEEENKLLNNFDIGIMPLPDNEWTRGKCGLKGLTYMACAIPTVMSPVGVNKDIIKDGVNGFLCKTEQEWISVLSKLIEDENLREKIGKLGLQTVQNNYSTYANNTLYFSAFNSVLTNG
jgi:glycosyltransferase involved in cell wall biosynthesis